MSLRTWKSKKELTEPVFSWCPWIQHGWARTERTERSLFGCQENGLGQIRTFIVHDGRACFGEWEDDYLPATLRETTTERFLAMVKKRRALQAPRLILLSRGGSA